MSAVNEYNIQGIKVQYRIRVSSRARHAYLKLLEDGIVEAILPKKMSKRYVPDMLRENHQWIADAKEKLLVRQQNNPVRYEQFPDRINLRATGICWTISYLEKNLRPSANKCFTEIQTGVFPQLVIYEKDAKSVQVILQKWIRQQAKKVLLPWFDRVSQEIAVPYNKISIRAQKSRWGSCSRDSNINLNLALLFLSPTLVRYVFIHELCHTHHMNHSQNFWALVEKFEPNYKEYDKALNTHSEIVPLWIHL
ncbi:hypothetical protein MNBD_GAMMA12-57 [hydrothermal vent metagenome]|uniref:YgjP-like metallopeptidase domain-containing protein n=1 Tax=hydrothermal vent metagenome TaxID=652676 RepID=A0A3B0YWD4_9ZZZZ